MSGALHFFFSLGELSLSCMVVFISQFHHVCPSALLLLSPQKFLHVLHV
jgi:hypothetical protein